MAVSKLIKGVRKTTKAAKKATKKTTAPKSTTDAAIRRRKRGEDKKSYETEGARRASDTGGSVNVSRDIDAGRAGKVTRGKASYTNFINDQLAASPGERAKSAVRKDFLAQINRAQADGDEAAVKKLRAALKEVQDRYDEASLKATRSARAKQSATMRGRKKEGRTDYVDPETGEIFGNPTPPQIKTAMSNLRARGMTKEARELEAFLDEQRIKAGDVKAGESAVGKRKGSRGMGIRAEDRGSNPDPINKRPSMMRGGAVKGKAHNYAAGGSVTDNLKRKKR